MFKLRKYIAFLGKSKVIALARLSPIGDLKAPGTFGSVAGIFFYLLFLFNLNTLQLLVISTILAYIAVNVCDLAEEYMHVKDPGDIVLDEFVAIPFCFLGINWDAMGSYNFVLIILGFVFFRFFDILKPLGIKKVQDLKGGLGCVMDDILAAFATCASLHIILYFWNNYNT